MPICRRYLMSSNVSSQYRLNVSDSKGALKKRVPSIISDGTKNSIAAANKASFRQYPNLEEHNKVKLLEYREK